MSEKLADPSAEERDREQADALVREIMNARNCTASTSDYHAAKRALAQARKEGQDAARAQMLNEPASVWLESLIEVARKEGAEEERKAVVSWLRRQQSYHNWSFFLVALEERAHLAGKGE